MDAQHVHVGAVQGGHALGGQDLVGRAHRPAAVDHEQHLVDQPQDGVDVVRHEQDRAARATLPASDDIGDLLLVVQVQAGQRLVAEQELRVPDQGLRDPQALLLATRQAADRRIGVRRCGYGPDRRVDATAHRGVGQPHPPAIPVHAELHEIAAANGQVGVEALVLGHVADARIAASGGMAQDLDLARAKRRETQDHPQE